MTLMMLNLCCSTVMAICGLWVLTERTVPRLVRLSSALIAAGGSVNVIGLLAALLGVAGFAYEVIWPGEVIVNMGASVLMARWTWRLHHHVKTTGKTT